MRTAGFPWSGCARQAASWSTAAPSTASRTHASERVARVAAGEAFRPTRHAAHHPWAVLIARICEVFPLIGPKRGALRLQIDRGAPAP